MKITLTLITCLISSIIFSQSPWVATNSQAIARYDDIYFLSPDTGWAAGGGSGIIAHTTNGGTTWATLTTFTNSYIRSIEFADKNLGFMGGLESGSGHNVFFKTSNGGTSWTDITSVITGTARGICGICCVNTSVTYAVGAWSTPAYVMKTSDGGNTWTQINMDAYAQALIDVQFSDANNGYVTGQSNINAEGAVILKTTDGGNTWTKVFTSNTAGEYVWKIQNLDGTNWFASIEGVHDPIGSTILNNVFLKSTDGGSTWVSKPVGPSHYFQGIGFINPQKGWIGNNELFETTDGGDTWNIIVPYNYTNQFDRFQRVNSTTAYFSSEKIYKLNGTVGINEVKTGEKKEWLSVYPNPAKEKISFHLNLPNKTMFFARLFNSKDEIIWQEVNQKEKGSYEFNIPLKLEAGIYFMYVMFNEGVECKKVIVD